MLTISKYQELFEFINAFQKKKLNLLIIVSRGGLGKTFITEEALMEQAPLTITGHVTPLKLYREVLTRTEVEKDFILVFDDVDALLTNKDLIALLKQICDTRDEKIIKYFTSSPILKDTPSEFETSCKVIMLMNSLRVEDPNIKALMSRAHLLDFRPPDTEILNNLKSWADDENILKFIERFAPFSKTLNLRVYKRAEELKDSGLDWKQEIINILEIDSRLFEISDLLKKYSTDKEREEHFSASRPSYYRFKKLFLLKNPEYTKKNQT